MTKEAIINFSSNSKQAVASQKGSTSAAFPPLLGNPNNTVARFVPSPVQPNHRITSAPVIRSPAPPKMRHCPYHLPQVNQQPQRTLDLLSKMEARDSATLQLQRLLREYAPPGIETLREWVSSLRLSDAAVDLRLRLWPG
ncbi:hypothetical protein VNO78_17232 [Psophocarpus tetragonolobus]|uniref:Uncharacterized protein n=1 Tax=Psophocarpus tetragonolobus TaxID=3891 RepID=A0AAN9XL40_PSOTE